MSGTVGCIWGEYLWRKIVSVESLFVKKMLLKVRISVLQYLYIKMCRLESFFEDLWILKGTFFSIDRQYNFDLFTSCKAWGISPLQGNTAQVKDGIVRISKPAGIVAQVSAEESAAL